MRRDGAVRGRKNHPAGAKEKIVEKRISYVEWESPCGRLTIASLEGDLVMADWTTGWHHDVIRKRFGRLLRLPFVNEETETTERTIAELEEYFRGERRTFDLPIRFVGTAFQLRVWRALQAIPYGALTTYGDLARTIGSPRAVRAVGGAVGQNPISIIVPCHRVVGKNDDITGYGGGYDAKRLLLSLELNRPAESFVHKGEKK